MIAIDRMRGVPLAVRAIANTGNERPRSKQPQKSVIVRA
jgi:hypothetical protein